MHRLVTKSLHARRFETFTTYFSKVQVGKNFCLSSIQLGNVQRGVEMTHDTQVPALRQQAKGDSHGGRGGKTSEAT